MKKETQEQFESIIYDRVAREEFIEKTFVTPSSLKHLEKSVYSFILNKIEPEPETDAMKFGSALHEACLFGMAEYASHYTIVPPAITQMNKNSNAYKDAFATFKERAGDKIILSEADHLLICDMQASYLNSEIYEEIYDEQNQEMLVEEMIEFEYNSVKCRGRLDVAAKKDNFWTVYDLKTTADTLDLEAISKSINNYKYYRQLEMYRMAMVWRYGGDMALKLVFLGKEYPHLPFTVDELDEKYYDTARMDIFFLTERWREFIENRDYMTIKDKYVSRGNFSAPLWLKSVGTY